MSKPSHDDVANLIRRLILPFYEVNRSMLVPTQPAGRRRNENDAEHSWSVATIACSLAPHIDSALDIGQIAQFALVHDLTEAIAGDTNVWDGDVALSSKEDAEKAALQKIQTQFIQFPWLVQTLEKYERQDTNEARYVRAIDKYVATTIRAMDGGEYFHANGITRQIFEQKMATVRRKAHLHSGAGEYFEKIWAFYESHPEHFPSEAS